MPLRTPGYRFDRATRQLLITAPSADRRVGAWPDLDAQELPYPPQNAGRWLNYIPTFALVRPYRRRKKKVARRTPAPSDTGSDQLAFGFADTSETAQAKPKDPHTTPVREQRRLALDAYRFAMPKEVARAVDGFRSHQWPLLHALRWNPRLAEFATANPALFFLLCHRHAAAAYNGVMPDPLGLKEAQVAGLLGLSASPSTAKILRKVPAASIQGEQWEKLIEVLTNDAHPSRKSLSHLVEVNFGSLTIALQPAFDGWATNALLEEVSATKQERHVARTAGLLRDLIAMRGTIDPSAAPRPVKSIARLQELHEETLARYLQIDDRRAADLRFPTPPISGDGLSIIPLTTGSDLVEEGTLQNNCVATYADRVVKRELSIYRVLHPERCTLSIARGSYGLWEIAELEIANNLPATRETRKSVERWLDEAAVPS